MTDTTTLEAAKEVENDVVHVIQSSYHYLDGSNRPVQDDTVMDEEGWFGDAESAAHRAHQLNEQNREHYEADMARQKRDRDARIARAEESNREAAVLRANGIAKNDLDVPAPFVPTPFEDYRPDSHTVYAAIQMRRSDHDGIAQAFAAKADDEG